MGICLFQTSLTLNALGFFIAAIISYRWNGMPVAQSIMHTSLVCIFVGLAFGISLVMAKENSVWDVAMLMVVGVLLPARGLINNWHTGVPIAALKSTPLWKETRPSS